MGIKFNQFIAWGHKLHSHTHSYIHEGFIKAFNYLGYKTLWLDNNDEISDIDFTNSLFLTAGQVDDKIPIRNDCYYILHNCDFEKYKILNPNQIQIIQVLTLPVYTRENTFPIPDTRGYYSDKSCIYFPWGTDLLPYEIDLNIENIDSILNKRKKFTLNFIGMPTEPWDFLKRICTKFNYGFNQVGGFCQTNVDSDKNKQLIQESYLSMAVQDTWQLDNGYLPCRVFKNISYGRMVCTNNKTVNEFFNNKLIYNNDLEKLFNDAIKFESLPFQVRKEKIIELMKIVRDNHTYLNSIKAILWGFETKNNSS